MTCILHTHLQVMAGVAELLREGMATLTSQSEASMKQLSAQNDALVQANSDLHAQVPSCLLSALVSLSST